MVFKAVSEKIDFEIEHNNFKSFTNITEILPLLK